MEAESGCCTSSTKARLVCVLLCVLSCFLSTSCLVAGIAHSLYSLHPSAAIVSGVQLGSGFLGSVAASVMLCCCHSGVALVLLQIAAVGLGSTAIALAFVCVQACALVVPVPAYTHDWRVPAYTHDWRAFEDEEGNKWSYEDRCSAPPFRVLPLFMASALLAASAAVSCCCLVATARRAPPPASGVNAAAPKGGGARVVSLALLLCLGTAVWGGACLGVLGSGAMQLTPAPAPPPRPPTRPPLASPPPPSPRPPPRWRSRRPHPHPPPPPQPAPPAAYPPGQPPGPALPPGTSLFRSATGPCKVVGACVTSSHYIACVDHDYCTGPSCVGPPCPKGATREDNYLVHPNSYSYEELFADEDRDSYSPEISPPPEIAGRGLQAAEGGLQAAEFGLQAAGRGLQAYRFGEEAGYGDYERCSIELRQPAVLEVVHFDTEECCDRLEVTALGGGARSTDEHHGYALGREGVFEGATTRRRSYGGFGIERGPAGVVATRLDWHSDGGGAASGWAICAAGHRADLAGSIGSFAEKGPAYPWHELREAWGFASTALASALLGLLAALLGASLLAAGHPLASPPSAACCQAPGAVRRAVAIWLAALGAAGAVNTGVGLVFTSAVACERSAHHCAPLLPLFWCGGLLCALVAPVLLALACALAPAASASEGPRREVYVARALILVDICTIALSSACLGITLTTYAFRHLPAVYLFSTLGIVAPAFGVGGAALVLRSAARAHVSATVHRREHASRMRLASGLLALHILLVGASFIGLPVAAAAGYGPQMGTYVAAAVACGVCAAVGLLLLMLVTQASSGLASEEMAEMVSANHDAFAASQQHVLELEHNMSLMIEQQAQLLAVLGQSAGLPPSAARPAATAPPPADAAPPPADAAPPPAAEPATGAAAESGAAALPTEVPGEPAEKV